MPPLSCRQTSYDTTSYTWIHMFRFLTWRLSSLCPNLREFNLDLNVVSHISSLFHLTSSLQCISVWLNHCVISVCPSQCKLRVRNSAGVFHKSSGSCNCCEQDLRGMLVALLHPLLFWLSTGLGSVNPLVRHRLRLRVHPLLWTALKSSLHLQSSRPARVLGTAGWHWEPWAQPSSPTPPWEGQNSTETPSELFLTEVRVVA